MHILWHVVLLFNDPHGLVWWMILTMQEWFAIVDLFIQDRSVPCSCSTVTGGLCIIAIMFSRMWDGTPVNHQFVYSYYNYDILTKPGIKLHTKQILNPITDTIPNLQVTSQPLQSYFYGLIPYFQCWWCWWCWWCHCCCCCGCCKG